MKITYNYLLISLLAMTLLSCKKDSTDCPERVLKTASYGFETSLDTWFGLGGKAELKDSSFFELTTDTSYSGGCSAKFIVSQSAYINSGVRSELSFDQQIEAGDETFYEYSFLVPSDYQDVSSLEAVDGRSNWQIIGQWHDQPDACIGQTWDDLGANPPPIAVYYNYLTTSDPAYQEILAGPEVAGIYGVDTTWNDVSVISIEYAGSTIAIAEIEKGEWVKLKFHIKWSTSADGFIEAWINNANFTDGQIMGANMNNNASHYFKFGMYRNPDITSINSIYYDDIEIYGQ